MATIQSKKIKESGFTLIELMVVVSIIAMLSTIVLAGLSYTRTRAQYAHAQSDMEQIAKAIAIAENQTSLPLTQITESTCTVCSRDWQSAISKIETKTAGISKGVSNIINDPWGNTYAVDENETEYSDTDCRPDTLLSGGPDGQILFSNWQDNKPAEGDDLKIVLPYVTPYCISQEGNL